MNTLKMIVGLLNLHICRHVARNFDREGQTTAKSQHLII